MHVRTTSAELARWLEREGGSWHVEGEATLAGSVPLPAPASALVDILRKGSGELEVLAPDGSELVDLCEDAPVTARELTRAAHLIDGLRVFQLAWIRPDGTVQDSWLLAEQRVGAGRGDDGRAARKLVASFRASVAPARR